VPIVPDEARTFGMEALFRQCGIYSHVGQLYEPVDADQLMYYKEARDGQILEEGITEAGSMSSFIAAGTAYANQSTFTIPFYIYYSMFGFQRIGDLIWAAADMRCRGFLIGGTAGRTTLNGEGLQHQDGHSHLLAMSVPNLLAYDPAFAYEIAIIIRDGLRRMFVDNEDVFYYVSADVWSVTSYKLLRTDALRARRWNMLHPTRTPRKSYVETKFESEPGPFVAVSDYMKMVPDQIAPWVPGGLMTLGTDGYGRSDTRENLRRFFEVDAESTVVATLYALAEKGEVDRKVVAQAIKDLGIDPEKAFPVVL
jgi:pyruvate dehydrogenase E1 component